MNAAEVTTFFSAEELASGVAARFLQRLEGEAGADGLGPPWCVALSGGRIAVAFFSALVAQGARAKTLLGRVHFFWADERCVPPGSPESNYTVARQRLFLPLALPEARIHRIKGELEPEVAAAQAETELRQVAPGVSKGQPVLDFVFLGMGEDGHVASLFPGRDQEFPGCLSYRSVLDSPKPPENRVSLTYSAIGASREIWVLVSGTGKAEALSKALGGDRNMPMGKLLRMRAGVKVFSDAK